MRSTPDAYQWSAKVLTGVRQHLLNLRAKTISTTTALTSLPLRQQHIPQGLPVSLQLPFTICETLSSNHSIAVEERANGKESESKVAGRSDR